MSLLHLAKLVGHDVVPVADVREWAEWFEATSKMPGPAGRATMRHVGDDEIAGLHVSTVFLGINHGWGEGPPLWFESMIFGGKLDGMQQRYATWDQAAAGHAFVLALAKGEAGIVRDEVAAKLAEIARRPA